MLLRRLIGLCFRYWEIMDWGAGEVGGIKKRGLKTLRKLGETVFLCAYKLQKIIPINND